MKTLLLLLAISGAGNGQPDKECSTKNHRERIEDWACVCEWNDPNGVVPVCAWRNLDPVPTGPTELAKDGGALTAAFGAGVVVGRRRKKKQPEG